MDGDKFLELWDELLSQPDVESIQIVAFRGSEPVIGPHEIVFVSDSTDPIQQLHDNVAYVKQNPYSEPKKRGRKKKV